MQFVSSGHIITDERAWRGLKVWKGSRDIGKHHEKRVIVLLNTSSRCRTTPINMRVNTHVGSQKHPRKVGHIPCYMSSEQKKILANYERVCGKRHCGNLLEGYVCIPLHGTHVKENTDKVDRTCGEKSWNEGMKCCDKEELVRRHYVWRSYGESCYMYMRAVEQWSKPKLMRKFWNINLMLI